MQNEHRPLALTALEHHDTGDHKALSALMTDQQAPAPWRGSEGLHGVMEDHSLVIDTGDSVIFSWFENGRWRAEHRAKAEDQTAFPPANRWHNPMYRWPSPASMTNRALLRLEREVHHDLRHDGEDLDYSDPDPEFPLISVQEAQAMIPGLHEAAVKAAQSNTGDVQLSALDDAESWGADDIEKHIDAHPDQKARVILMMKELMRFNEVAMAA